MKANKIAHKLNKIKMKESNIFYKKAHELKKNMGSCGQSLNWMIKMIQF